MISCSGGNFSESIFISAESIKEFALKDGTAEFTVLARKMSFRVTTDYKISNGEIQILKGEALADNQIEESRDNPKFHMTLELSVKDMTVRCATMEPYRKGETMEKFVDRFFGPFGPKKWKTVIHEDIMDACNLLPGSYGSRKG